MPTNTRTPLPSGDICAPTPSDTVGTLDNLLARVEALEKELAQLKSGDLSVYNLSLLSPQYSAVNNALALSMLPAGVTEQFPGSAWVTAYGTISGIVFPSDFVKNLYGGVDGVMQYEVGSLPGGRADVSYIEFNTDGTSGGGNLLSPFNSVIDSSDDVDDWLSYTTGSGAGTVAFQEEGIYAVYYQAVIIGSSAGVRLPCKASFLSSSTASAVCYGASVVDEDDVETSFLNMSAIFEVPNITASLSVGEVNSFVPYVEAMPASGSHNFSTVNSTLRIAKIG